MRTRGGIFELRVSDLSVYVFTIILLALECSLFFLDIIPTSFFRISSYTSKYFISAIILVGTFFTLTITRNKSNYIFAIPILAFSTMCLIITIASSVFYHSSISRIFLTALPYITVPLLYFVLHDITQDERMYIFFIKTFIAFALIYAIFCILQSFDFAVMNTEFQNLSMRAGRIRLLMSGDFITFGALITLGMIYSSEKSRAIYITLFAIMFFELFWVAQTRIELIGLSVCVISGFILKAKRPALRIILVLLISLLLFSQFSEIISTAFFPSKTDVSSFARLNAYEYYWPHAMDMGFFGLGYIPEIFSQGMFGLVWYGNTARGDITDIGVIGYLARYGICGAIVLALGIVWLVRAIIRRNKKHFSLDANPEAWMALVYLIVVSPIISFTDVQRIFYLPIVGLLIEHALVSPSIRNSTTDKRV